MSKQKIIKTAKTVLVVGAMLGFVGLASASTTFTPPGTGYAFPTNVDAPLNVGSAGQIKIGSLTTNSTFATNGLTNFGTLSQVGMANLLGGLKVAGGSAGQVLTWGTGSTASWATPAAGGGITSLDPLHLSGTDAWPTARFGSSAATISGDAGGSIELGALNGAVGSGTPYIDFHGFGVGTDFNMRIMNSANGLLEVMGGDLKVGGSSVCRENGTHCPAAGGTGRAIYMTAAGNCVALSNQNATQTYSVAGNLDYGFVGTNGSYPYGPTTYFPMGTVTGSPYCGFGAVGSGTTWSVGSILNNTLIGHLAL